MESALIYRGLLDFIAFVAFVVLHEYAHAWMAVRCGDDTPRLQKRLTLDPLAHIELIGTIILPLVVTLASIAGGQLMLLGWGRPVEVNLNNFKNRRRDDILVSAAGPAMNLLIAVVLLLVAKGLELTGNGAHLDSILNLARLSLFLCMFNLLPIPPLDGGHILRQLIGISDEVYHALSRYSFLFLLLIFRVPEFGQLAGITTDAALSLLARPFGWELAVN